MSTVSERLTEVLRDIFADDSLETSASMTAADVNGWDSMGNVRLFLAIEEEFGVRFSAGEIGGIDDVGELIKAIEAKLK